VCCLIYKVLLLFAITFATAYLVYHTLSRLSSTFLSFFKLFFQHRLSRQLVYCIISAPLCQYLFSTFFQNFFKFLPVVFPVSSIASSPTAFIYYHIKLSLSIGFLNFFDFASFSATAFIYYHNCFDLSIGFLNFFQQAVEKRVRLFISASLSTTPPSHICVPPPLTRGGKNGGLPVEKANDYSYFLVYLQSLHRLSRSPSLYTREARGGVCCGKRD